MTSHTTEQAFESTVEPMLLEAGWHAGDLGEWDVERALFPARAVAFIRETQPDEWARHRRSKRTTSMIYRSEEPFGEPALTPAVRG